MIPKKKRIPNNRLRDFRRKAGFSRLSLAIRAGVSKETIKFAEAGIINRHHPGTMDRIAKVLSRKLGMKLDITDIFNI